MFAPPITKQQSKAAPNRSGKPAAQRSPEGPANDAGATWRFGDIPVMARSPIQAKLIAGPVDDPQEQEADRIAGQVMRAPDNDPAPVRRISGQSGGEAAVAAPRDALSKAPPIVTSVLQSAGRPLDADARDFMEPRFGYDFSKVSVHADGQAAIAARALQARAFTVGHHIVFGPGEYAPATSHGRQLIAHELAHVMQQGGTHSSPSPAAPIQRKKTQAGDELPDDTDVTWDGDTFTLSFDRVMIGSDDTLLVVITYKGKLAFDGAGVRGKAARLRFDDLGPRLLKVTMTAIDSGVNLDLYGDGTRKIQVRDTYSTQTGKGRRHDLELRELGTAHEIITTWVLDASAKADARPDTSVDVLPDVPGEKPSVYMAHGKKDTEWGIRVDGDGDQYKELMLTVRAVTNFTDPVQKDIPKRLEVKVQQVSSGVTRTVFFDLAKPASGGGLFPIVEQVSDSKLPTIIDLEVPSKFALLELWPPTAAGTNIAYRLAIAGQNQTATFQPEKAGLHQVAGADRPKVVGGISSVDITLGAYADRFRLTVQPQPNNQAVLGVSVMYAGEPDSGVGVPLQLNAPLNLSVTHQSGLSLGLDLDGDGKTDLEVYDQLDSPKDSSGDSNPESDRDHTIRIEGPAITGGQAIVQTLVRNGSPMGGHETPTAMDMQAASNAQAVSSLPKQTATYEQDLDRIEAQLQKLRKDAVAASVISQGTYDAWLALSRVMIQLRAEQSVKVSAATQSTAAQAAATFYAALAQEVASANRPQFSQVSSTITNPYTGLDQSTVITRGTTITGFGPELEAKIKSGSWADATTYYNQLVNGLDRWIADQLKDKTGHRDEARTAQYLAAAQSALGTIESKNPIRIQAIFHPEEQFLESSRITEMPLALYFWRDGSKWHLADLTNPLNTFEDTYAAAATDKAPPPDLFEKLDARIHFPKGIIHYQIPGGEAGNFRTTAQKHWTDYLSYIGLGAAVIGVTLATFGTGTVAVAGAWILAASGVISAAGTTAEMIEKWRHGNLDATEAIIDIAQIVASLAGAAALSSAKIVTLAGDAVKAGAPWAANWARLAVMADRLFVPMVGTKVAADVVTGVAITVETAKQLDAIELGAGTRDAKARAKMLLLSQAALSLGMLSLSVKGELGTIKPGRELILYYPPEEGGVIKPPIALIGDEVAPGSLKFSQANVKSATGEGQPLDDLVKSMETGGWKGNPLEVVEMADGTKVSIDNRRLLAAQKAGLKEVPIAVHDAADKLPPDQRARFQLTKYTIRKLDTGELVVGGNKGQVVYAKGALPNTYEEAALFRTADQGNLPEGKGRFPLLGRYEQPTVRQPKPGTAKPGDIE
jgi:hypothetical protein